MAASTAPTTRRRSGDRVEQATDVAITAFLWGIRIVVILVMVVGSALTLASGRYDLDNWISFVREGATLGAIYALTALGYTMVYGILRMINFAHGEILTVGAFGGYFTATALAAVGVLNGGVLYSILSVVLMMAVAAVTAVIVNVLVERIAYRPLRNAPRLVPLISALGASFFLQYSMRGFFGDGVYNYPTITVLEQKVDLFGLGFLQLKWLDVLVISSAIVMMVALYLFVQRSKVGTSIRAVSEDKATAALMGINVNRAIVLTFVLGAALAGVAGVLYGMLFRQIYYLTGFLPGLKAFTAAVLGGIGNIPGAMLGGFLLGEIESIGPTLFLEGLGVPSPTQIHDVIAFTMLVFVLLFRPSGLLGERVTRQRA